MNLREIKEKVFSEERLSQEDALGLFESNDIFTIGRLASYASNKKNGNNVYFIQNRHINPTNICINRCKFCAFSRSKGERGAYELTIEEIIEKIRIQNTEYRIQTKSFKQQTQNINSSLVPRPSSLSISEVHITGGLHPDWPFELYLEILKRLKESFPHIHIKAFTAVEVDYFSKISGLSLTDTLKALKAAGLDSMPGGGAEIFHEDVRKKICPEKIDGRRWLEIMAEAHRLGIKSNATMLYGHIEQYEHRVDHMLQLRDLQDSTGGFQAFIPLCFHSKNTELFRKGYTSGLDDIKTIAVSRLFLDNFAHIKAYWVMLGKKVAQLCLLFGADDLDGTVVEEKITHSAGAISEKAISKDELINLIEKTGKVPVERDSFYKETPMPTNRHKVQ
ncbi:MAG: CofH family radical SAM protein [Nitrospirae bacterium]|nr:CofH family radical SAM protein [Nitrospirota bacterium]